MTFLGTVSLNRSCRCRDDIAIINVRNIFYSLCRSSLLFCYLHFIVSFFPHIKSPLFIIVVCFIHITQVLKG